MLSYILLFVYVKGGWRWALVCVQEHGCACTSEHACMHKEVRHGIPPQALSILCCCFVLKKGLSLAWGSPNESRLPGQ